MGHCCGYSPRRSCFKPAVQAHQTCCLVSPRSNLRSSWLSFTAACERKALDSTPLDPQAFLGRCHFGSSAGCCYQGLHRRLFRPSLSWRSALSIPCIFGWCSSCVLRFQHSSFRLLCLSASIQRSSMRVKPADCSHQGCSNLLSGGEGRGFKNPPSGACFVPFGCSPRSSCCSVSGS